jgi:hypothetical protein
MSDYLAIQRGGPLPTRLDRQVGRALDRISADQVIALRRDEARIERVAVTAERGMTRAAQLGLLEATLAAVAPDAAGYVHASAVAGAIGIAGVVHDASRGL